MTQTITLPTKRLKLVILSLHNSATTAKDPAMSLELHAIAADLLIEYEKRVDRDEVRQ